MEGNIIDAAKNLLGGDFTTELRYRFYNLPRGGETYVNLEDGSYIILAIYNETVNKSDFYINSNTARGYRIMYILHTDTGTEVSDANYSTNMLFQFTPGDYGVFFCFPK